MDLQIKHKMILALLVPLLLLASISVLAVNVMGKIDNSLNSLYEDRVVPLEDLKIIADEYAVSVIDAINKANAGGMSAQETAIALQSATQTIKQRWDKYLSTTLTSKEQQLTQEADELFTPANNAISNLNSKIASLNGNISGQLTQDIIPLYKVIDPISSKISELISLQLNVAKEEKGAAHQAYATSTKWFVALTICALLASIVLGIWVNRSVMRPITNILSTLRVVRENLDLRVDFKVYNNDELGQISRGLTGVIQHLGKILNGINQAAMTINESSDELSRFTQQTNERMSLQQNETEQTATAMNQMTATVQEVAQSANSAADSAREADSTATSGNEIVQKSIQSMSKLSAQIEQTSVVINRLNVESQNIGQVLEVIKGIAEQTNLLALNAAIEAARAGEQGRGFAVVADEVRTLAQRTQKSTLEIESMIEKLQSGVKEAVTSMELGTHDVKDANEHTIQAGDALIKIVNSVDVISDMNTHIATAAEEQSSVAEAINQSILAISDIAKTASTAAQELEISVSQLNEVAVNMRSQVGEFKLKSEY
ncbi:methyl-accepting chemotaxis protein [Motilimonas cestriensis]|uniref:Methyl-accepting chemotaxis protein n=1 Tax=Motilimonas cestriensis TaxID=2742685 RepID=A0ABS8W702_9GAMM|nr:methyl-accepting chemotaxis protein [Motilimonas cestriensis]MCE2593877.1 methyl-accepting chemotaxis protein [Motilimonas cestriensis]